MTSVAIQIFSARVYSNPKPKAKCKQLWSVASRSEMLK